MNDFRDPKARSRSLPFTITFFPRALLFAHEKMSFSQTLGSAKPREAAPVYRCGDNHWHFVPHRNEIAGRLESLPWWLQPLVSHSPLSLFEMNLIDCNQQLTRTSATVSGGREVLGWCMGLLKRLQKRAIFCRRQVPQRVLQPKQR